MTITVESDADARGRGNHLASGPEVIGRLGRFNLPHPYPLFRFQISPEKSIVLLGSPHRYPDAMVIRARKC